MGDAQRESFDATSALAGLNLSISQV
jgi:hypothetical protein